MRILSIRPIPVGLIFTIMYGFFGLLNFIIFRLSNNGVLTLLLGYELGFFHLALVLHLPRTDDLIANAFQCGASIALLGLTGWITGIASVLCFNFVAAKIGGIDARFANVSDNGRGTGAISNTAAAGPLAASSSGGAPTTTDRDISARNPQSSS